MPTNENFHFSVGTVASYLYHLRSNISPIKLQKGLYFLFAYYGALYGNEAKEGYFEGTIGRKKLLFDAEFQAWQYGPVIREVWQKDHENYYCDSGRVKEAIKEIENEPEVKKFIDDLFEQIDAVSDFKLVDRSHQDTAWINAYSKGQSTVMDNNEIFKQYREDYV